LPWSINLKPIGNLSIDDFRNDFEIIGAVKRYKSIYRPWKGTNPSIILFSTVAAKLECLFMLVYYKKQVLKAW
jgi:hypothetical protein